MLPVVVVTELEGKRHHPELGYFARQALRLLDDLRVQHGRLDAPVPVGDDGGTAAGRAQPHRPAARCRPDSGWGQRHPHPRGRRNLAAEGFDVTVVSKDLPMRVKASAVGPRRRGVPRRARRRLRLDRHDRARRHRRARCDRLYEDGRVELPAAAELPCHTGLVLLSAARQRPRAGSAPTSRSGWSAVTVTRSACTVESAEQRIALDLLLDPDVGIVSLGGRAGTGKSALALCAGLEAVMERRQHRKVVVFRPLYAVGGQDLGYLPGTEAEKMSPWGQAVFDTLGALVSTEVVEEVLDRGMLEVLPLTHIRGRSLHDAFVDRRRGPVAGAQRPAHRPVPHRPELQGRPHPRRRPARQPAGGPARRRGGGHRGPEGPPPLRPRHPDPVASAARSPRWSPTCSRASTRSRGMRRVRVETVGFPTVSTRTRARPPSDLAGPAWSGTVERSGLGSVTPGRQKRSVHVAVRGSSP